MTETIDDERHVPLHQIEPGEVVTAGRAHKNAGERKLVTNAHMSIDVEWDDDWNEGDLVRIEGYFDGESIAARRVEIASNGRRPRFSQSRELDLGEAISERARLYRAIRRFFAADAFLEVETQALVPSPGTDVHLDPVAVELRAFPGASERMSAYLHTSPEFAMKRLLSAGFERIYQLGKVWRNGEVSRHHSPEFTLLEWYRAWQGVDAIIDDVERLVRAVLPEHFTAHGPNGSVDVRLDRGIPRETMREVVLDACGFDILECLDIESLSAAIVEQRLFDPSGAASWADLFAELQVTVLDPYFARRRAILVTHWPTPVAVLARKDPDDPRQSERFELYVGGVEIANGFGELTDPDEQRERFREDDAERFARRLPRLPMPELFLENLRDGMPPAAGVALGVDRLLMLKVGARTISDVCPFALERDSSGGWNFG